MAFDVVKLAIAVEDAFGFIVPDEDLPTLNTAGKWFDYVLAHRFRGKRQACLRSITCYHIRRAIMSVLQIPREELQAETPLSTIIPRHRRRVWRALQKTSGFRLPQLRRPRWVATAVMLATIGLAIAVPVLLSFTLLNGAVLVGILTAFTVGYACSWLTRPLEIDFHPECPTMGQLAVATLARNYRAIVGALDTSVSDAEVWQRLSSILAEQLGGRARNITTDMALDKTSAMIRPEMQPSTNVDPRWVAGYLPCGQNSQLPLPCSVEHQ